MKMGRRIDGGYLVCYVESVFLLTVLAEAAKFCLEPLLK